MKLEFLGAGFRTDELDNSWRVSSLIFDYVARRMGIKGHTIVEVIASLGLGPEEHHMGASHFYVPMSKAEAAMAAARSETQQYGLSWLPLCPLDKLRFAWHRRESLCASPSLKQHAEKPPSWRRLLGASSN